MEHIYPFWVVQFASTLIANELIADVNLMLKQIHDDRVVSDINVAPNIKNNWNARLGKLFRKSRSVLDWYLFLQLLANPLN